MAIISASRRTDIPAFHGAWFMDKIGRGFCHVANPFNGKVEKVLLGLGDVDAFVFWSRNYAPMLRNLERLRAMGHRFYCQFTINCYPRFIDPAAPSLAKAARTAHALCRMFGPDTVVWRYDPVMLTSGATFKWHERNYAAISKALEGAADTCVISFIDWYRKLDRNLLPALDAGGAQLLDPSLDELKSLALSFAGTAKSHGMRLETCCEPDFDLPQTSCIDRKRLRAVTGKDFTDLKLHPTRKGCNCAVSKDIGAYDTCVMGCAYCYANRSRKSSFRNLKEIHTGDLSL
ncbi:MAG: DUF1848 domain-containing protein [Nitrospinae bacterium]|nr:DUF1848 domain-containing protein [Nitrospinota bacterium]